MFVFCFSVTQVTWLWSVKSKARIPSKNPIDITIILHHIALCRFDVFDVVHCFAMNRTCRHFTQIRFPNVWNLKNHGCLCKLGSSQFILSGLVFRFSTGCTHPKNSNGIQNWNTRFLPLMIFLLPNGLIFSLRHLFCTYVYQLSERCLSTQDQISLRFKDIQDSDTPVYTRMNYLTSSIPDHQSPTSDFMRSQMMIDRCEVVSNVMSGMVERPMSDWIGRKDMKGWDYTKSLYLFGFMFQLSVSVWCFLFLVPKCSIHSTMVCKSKGTIESGNLKESVERPLIIGVTNRQTFTGTNAWHSTYIELEHDYFLEEDFFQKKSFRFQSSRLSDLIFDLCHAVSWDSALSRSAHLPIWEEYMKTPPPPEWDGVEHLKSKSFGCPKMEDPLWREVCTWPRVR